MIIRNAKATAVSNNHIEGTDKTTNKRMPTFTSECKRLGNTLKL